MEEIISINTIYIHLIKKIIKMSHTLMIEIKMYSLIVIIEFTKQYIH